VPDMPSTRLEREMPASTPKTVLWRRPWLRRWLPLAVLAAGLATFFALGCQRYLNFETLAEHRGQLQSLVAAYPSASAAAFAIGYAVVVAFSLPVGVLMTVAGGFLFGTLAATVLIVAAATVGSVVVFLIARSALGEPLRRRAGPFMQKLQQGFHANAWSYLLVLRLVPLFPFWLVNIVPALLNVRLSTYAGTTLIGIIPGTFVYANLGGTLDMVLARGATPDLGIILHPRILSALLALAVLSLLPVAYRHWRASRGRPAQP
jgi:uncharacterized membrane protein YdjX (TVP38/TMEM64 family)